MGQLGQLTQINGANRQRSGAGLPPSSSAEGRAALSYNEGMKFRFAVAVLLAAVSFAQTAPPEAPKPPADVDQALRARVNEFYDLLVKREFRKAEALIADDTKDYYYSVGKPTITKFALQEIRYSDNFTRAISVVKCTQKVSQPGFPLGEWDLPVPGLWKYENGNWYWYVNQKQVMTPVGIVKNVGEDQGSAAGSAPVPGGEIPKGFSQVPDFALGRVGADKKMVTLEGDKTEKVTIVNGSAGQIRLLMPSQLGLDLKLEPAALLEGEKAVLTLRATKDSVGGTLYVQIIPTHEVLAIQVVVK
jgi:hypothetical protein